jgi:membrane associated rhomboid family serine protease
MRVPIITAVAVGVAAVAAIAQYATPAVVPLLQRESWTVATVQWWRLVTPLFVQTLGWHQVAMNLITLALVGTIVERRLGRLRWAVLFVAGTVGGQVAAFTWQLPGGGDSIAICGLAGGMTAWLLADRREASRLEVGVVVCYAAALTGWGFGGVRGAAVAVVIAGLVAWTTPAWIGLLGTVAGAVALTTATDLHGVALLAGMAAATFTSFRRKGSHDEASVRGESGASRRVT